MRIFSLFIALFGLALSGLASASPLQGAWLHEDGGQRSLLLFQDGYHTATRFTDKELLDAQGGPYKVEGQSVEVTQEFRSDKQALAPQKLSFELKEDQLLWGEKKQPFKRVDASQGALAGVWKITGRMQEGEMKTIHTSGTRKTLKMLTGARFQWFAIDPGKGLFMATGGGSYTFQEGQYVEKIEFFSKDASRVGASLSFQGRVEAGKWHHSGKSSKGDAIHEIWEKVAP